MPDQNLEDRLKRADSWIQATAALRPEQLHESFIFLYIAFNCLYGRRQYEGDETQIGKDLAEFFKKVRAMSDRDVDAAFRNVMQEGKDAGARGSKKIQGPVTREIRCGECGGGSNLFCWRLFQLPNTDWTATRTQYGRDHLLETNHNPHLVTEGQRRELVPPLFFRDKQPRHFWINSIHGVYCSTSPWRSSTAFR